MAKMLFFSAGSPPLQLYQEAMRSMIQTEACKLGVANPDAYFTAGHDYVLAVQGGELLSLCVIKRNTLPHATYLGYSLAITKPEARRSRLVARMLVLYLLRALPRLLWSALKGPGHKLFVFGDIGSPLLYAKTCQLKTPIYPNLIRGDTPEQRERGAKLREDIIAHCNIRNMWQRPGVERRIDCSTGLIQDHGEAAAKQPIPPRGEEFSLDRHWHTRWQDYVPANSDLLVIVPLTPLLVLRQLDDFIKFGFRRPNLAKPSQLRLVQDQA